MRGDCSPFCISAPQVKEVVQKVVHQANAAIQKRAGAGVDYLEALKQKAELEMNQADWSFFPSNSAGVTLLSAPTTNVFKYSGDALMTLTKSGG